MEKGSKLELRLFGAFECRWSDGQSIVFPSAKQRALIVMLAVATNGLHSRNWIQEHLWGRSGDELGRQSLRRALSDMRKMLGVKFDDIFDTSNFDLRLRLENVVLISAATDGEFLAGINIKEPKFQRWLSEYRLSSAPSSLILDSDSRLAISPTVAIMPLVSVAGNDKETHFGDLIAMDIARALSRSRFLDVISHLSSRRLSRPRLELLDLKQKLNADYVVGGNVRIDGERYRLDADFLQASTGRILWTESFHGDLAEILNGNSELIARIAQKCGQEVLRASVEIAHSRPLPEVAEHALFMSSITGMHQHHLANFARSRASLEELIARLPKHSLLHAWLAKWYLLSIAQGWSTDVQKDALIAADSTARALDINPTCATSLTIDGMVQGDRKDDMSVPMSRFEAAIEIDPNQSLAWLMYSRLNSFLGKGGTAVNFASKAIRLSPIDPQRYFYDIMGAMAHVVNGEMEVARKLAERSLAQNPRHISSYRVLLITQQLSGQESKARETAKIIMRLEPTLTVEKYLRNHPAGQMETGRIWANALKQAGVPKQ